MTAGAYCCGMIIISHIHWISTTSRKLKPQLYITLPDDFTCYAATNITDRTLSCLVIICIPFNFSPISTNVSSGGTILLPALVRWAHSIFSYRAINFNWCCYHCSCHCYYLYQCSALHRCSEWRIPSNVIHLMALVAFLRIAPFGVVTCMLLIFLSATITLTVRITELQGLLSLLWIQLLAICLEDWEQGCRLCIIFLRLLFVIGCHIHNNLLLIIGQSVHHSVHQ